MRHELKIILASLLTAVSAFMALGNAPADSVKVFFRAGYTRFDPALDNNRLAMERFIGLVRMKQEANKIDSIVVRGYASPEGVSVRNEHLSGLRCQSIADIIVKEAGVCRKMIHMVPEGVAWKELRNIVATYPDVPSREKVLYILDNVPLWIRSKSTGEIVDGRKKRLMDLDRGETFRWLQLHVFPQLRNTVAIALYSSPKEPDLSDRPDYSETSAKSEFYEPSDISEVSDKTVISDKSEYSDKSVISDKSEYTDKSSSSDKSEVSDKSDKSEFSDKSYSSDTLSMPPATKEPSHFNMAVKTNMLYDALLVPNLGLEFCLGRNLSVYGEWMYAWWDNDRRHRYWRVYGGDIGLRWWFGSKSKNKPLTGHHLGIYGGILTFDFEVGDTGYMGGKPGGTLWDRWLVNTGIEYGYSLSVGKRLNIDFSIGLGYMGGNYIKYYPFDNDYYFDKEYNMHYFGPTKAEISLVWLLGPVGHSRKGGVK